jgi:hypothetical protein
MWLINSVGLPSSVRAEINAWVSPEAPNSPADQEFVRVKAFLISELQAVDPDPNGYSNVVKVQASTALDVYGSKVMSISINLVHLSEPIVKVSSAAAVAPPAA